MKLQVIKTKHVKPNDYNPNEMTKKAKQMLKSNIEEAGFVDPIVVERQDDKTYVVIDGEHRWREAVNLKIKEIPAVVMEKDEWNEDQRKLQTVRLNKIKGQMNITKFNKLVDDLFERQIITPETAAEKLGFEDPDEFEWMREELRESLPSESARKEFDKKSKEIKTIDGLTSLVEKLMQKHGNELLANFMVVEMDHGKNLWVKLDGRLLEKFELKARQCLEAGYTFDSVLVQLLRKTKLPEFIEKNHKKLISVDDELMSLDDYLINREP